MSKRKDVYTLEYGVDSSYECVDTATVSQLFNMAYVESARFLVTLLNFWLQAPSSSQVTRESISLESARRMMEMLKGNYFRLPLGKVIVEDPNV